MLDYFSLAETVVFKLSASRAGGIQLVFVNTRENCFNHKIDFIF